MSAQSVETGQSDSRLHVLQDLYRKAALELELPGQEVQRAAEEGILTLMGVEVHLLLTADERAVVISADAGADALKTVEQQRLALQCTLALALCAGMSIGYGDGQTLMSFRWAIDEDGARELAIAIADLVAMTTSVRQVGIQVVADSMSLIFDSETAK